MLAKKLIMLQHMTSIISKAMLSDDTMGAVWHVMK